MRDLSLHTLWCMFLLFFTYSTTSVCKNFVIPTSYPLLQSLQIFCFSSLILIKISNSLGVCMKSGCMYYKKQGPFIECWTITRSTAIILFFKNEDNLSFHGVSLMMMGKGENGLTIWSKWKIFWYPILLLMKK